MADWRIERLDRAHIRAGFDCGKQSLNDFLHALVSQYEKRDLGRTYVALAHGELRIIGYYTLACGSIATESLSSERAKKLPRHPVPVALIARLAIAREAQGKGLGAALLRDALSRSLELSQNIGVHAVIVDALDEQDKAFYERFGFLPLTDNPRRLYLPMGTIRATRRKP